MQIYVFTSKSISRRYLSKTFASIDVWSETKNKSTSSLGIVHLHHRDKPVYLPAKKMMTLRKLHKLLCNFIVIFIHSLLLCALGNYTNIIRPDMGGLIIGECFVM
jgi:hypothetical protein